MQPNNRYGKPQGWRGDGQQVPGNEPGGANGSYGGYGQDPDAQPPDQPPSTGMQPQHPSLGGMLGGMAHGVMQGAQSHFNKSPVGQAVQAYHRYGMPAQAAPTSIANTDDSGAPGPEPPQPMGSSAPPSNDLAGSLASGARMSDANDPGNPQMKDGGIITKPTMVMLAEHGQPEAVVPLDGHAGSKLRPGMFSSGRYRGTTGLAMTRGPVPPMAPAILDDKLNGGKKSGWKRWDMAHSR